MRRRFDERIAEGRKAQELDPLSPQIANMLAYDYISARRYDEAIASGQKSGELEPNVPIYHSSIALPYALKGQFELARKEFEKIKDQIDPVTNSNENAASFLGWFYAVTGKRDDALRMIKQFEALSAHSYVDSYFIAQIYAGLRDKDQAFRCSATRVVLNRSEPWLSKT